MANKFKNFDKQFSQMRRDTITLRIFDKDYVFPAVIPALIPLEMARYEGEDNVPASVMLRAARVMYGDEALSDWSHHASFDTEMLGEVIKTTFEMINGQDDGDAPEGLTEDDVGTSPKK